MKVCKFRVKITKIMDFVAKRIVKYHKFRDNVLKFMDIYPKEGTCKDKTIISILYRRLYIQRSRSIISVIIYMRNSYNECV